MWRVVTSTCIALTFISSAAWAQQPCTTDAARVVAEIYRHTLERGVDPGAQRWEQELASGRMNVRELVRAVAKSQEYMNKFGRTEAGEGQPFERAVARLYRHVLGRQPDAGGQRQWAQVAQERGLAHVVDELINSAEYSQNFGDWQVPGSGGITFCAPNASQSSNRTSQPLGPRRFENMDRNNDNVVSRGEWRGSNQSFRVHDWNNDGVLSGDEVASDRFRPGESVDFEDFDRAERFEYLDANNNGRIEQREWHASARAFRVLDVNSDGVLNRREYNSGIDTVPTTGEFIAVGGDRSWVDTGINVRAGDTLAISADGQIRLSQSSSDVVTAAGAVRRAATGSPIANAPAGSLIARIGNGPAMFVGDTRTFRAPRAGRLYLGINDDYLQDNTGQFEVTVDIR